MDESTAVNQPTQAQDSAPDDGFSVQAPNQAQGGTDDGFSVQPPDAQPASGGYGVLNDVGQHVENIAANAGKAAAGTAAGAADLASKFTTATTGQQAPSWIKNAIAKGKAMGDPNNGSGNGFDKIAGYGGETLLEFMMGDEALKGLSLADKLLTTQKIVKALEGSPKLMEALKAGASMGKAASELSPEETILVKRYPTLGRFVAAGMDAMRMGTTQAAQTGVRTGDAGEALKSGAEMAGTAGALGAVAAPVGGALAKVADANNTIEGLSDAAANAPSHQAIVDSASDMVNGANERMHSDFENTVQGMQDKTAGTTIGLNGSPLQDAAKNVAQDASDSERPLDAAYQGSTPQTKTLQNIIDKTINPFEDEEAEEEANQSKVLDESGKPYEKEAVDEAPKDVQMDMKELIDRRMQLGKKMRDLEYGHSDRAIYGDMIEGVDKTIEQLANKTGNPDIISDYQTANTLYRQRLARFQNADVKSLMKGNVNDVAARLSRGETSIDDMNTVRDVIGPENMNTLGDAINARWVADSTEGNRFDPSKYLAKWNKPKPEVRDALFSLDKPFGPVTQRVQAYNQFIDSVKDSASAQRLIKYGLVAPVGAAVGSAAGAHVTAVGAIIGGILGAGGAQTVGHATKMLDYIANSPWLWSKLSAASELGASPIIRTAATATKAMAGKGVDDIRRSVYNGTSNSLSQ